jgi:hypothetical protein
MLHWYFHGSARPTLPLQTHNKLCKADLVKMARTGSHFRCDNNSRQVAINDAYDKLRNLEYQYEKCTTKTNFLSFIFKILMRHECHWCETVSHSTQTVSDQE